MFTGVTQKDELMEGEYFGRRQQSQGKRKVGRSYH